MSIPNKQAHLLRRASDKSQEQEKEDELPFSRVVSEHSTTATRRGSGKMGSGDRAPSQKRVDEIPSSIFSLDPKLLHRRLMQSIPLRKSSPPDQETEKCSSTDVHKKLSIVSEETELQLESEELSLDEFCPKFWRIIHE